MSKYTDPSEFLLAEYSRYAKDVAEGDPMAFDDWLAGSDLPEIAEARELAKVQERNLSPMWTRSNSQAFLLEVRALFAGMGLQLSVVGSVASKGQSDKDLDVLVAPLPGVQVTLEDALTKVCDGFLPTYTVDTIRSLNPLPTSEPEDQTFVNLGLRDGRTIELFFPERLFPFETDMQEVQHLRSNEGRARV